MTNIKIRRNKNGSIVGFEAEGHSGYACEGEDIVCASVSAVMWNTVNGLLNVLKIPVQYEERDGFVKCVLPPLSAEEQRRADILLESMSMFFDELQKQYSGFVLKTEV